MNSKGFTLVELIGSMVILGLLMLVVVPNVVGLMKSNRETVYMEDAKKLANIAKAKVSNHKIDALYGNQCTFLGMGYLENSEFDNPPNGGCYDVNRSLVIVRKNENNEYDYYVQLVEFHDGKFNGILTPTKVTEITKDTIKQGIKPGDPENPIRGYNYTDIGTVIANFPLNNTVLADSKLCQARATGDNNYKQTFIKNGPKTYSNTGEGLCAK